jgi:transcriptional regulator with XRE-family HTH domain
VTKFEKRYNLEIKALGERIKAIRIQKKLTQLDLEVSSGINRTEISRIETGQKNVEFITLVRLAFALEVEVKDFFTL